MRLLRDGPEGVLTWEPSGDPVALERGVAEACRHAFADQDLHRLVARVAVDDTVGRRTLHRQGFRFEGLLRGAARRPDGTYTDLRQYARLATDVAAGRDGFTAVMNTVTPRKRLIAHALVQDAAARVLLCETFFKPDWELPGGIVEPFESPADGLSREMEEEMGWGPEVGRPLVVDWLRPYLGWEDALELVFATRTVSETDATRLTADGHEILALHWLTPDAAVERMTDFGGRRLRAALAAASEGTTRYTEGGSPRPSR